MVNKNGDIYRTVILRLEPDEKQKKVLRKLEREAIKFLGMSRYELQNMLYHKFKELNLSARTISLLVRRFTGSMGNKAVIPFDGDNSKFIRDEKYGWCIEIQALKGRNKRIKIPIARKDVKYYEAIHDEAKYPFTITRENDKWFCYISIPVKNEADGKVIGIDFNMHKWVAAPREGSPVIFYDVRKYEGEIDRVQRLLTRWHRKYSDAKKKHDREAVNNALNKIRELNKSINDAVKRAHGDFLRLLIEKYRLCTLAIEDIEAIYRLTEKNDRMVNNWLYRKTALRQFVLRAMAKGFRVVEVDPRNTTKTCHRCGGKLIIYGRRYRLVKCPKCGLKDYNRDLNAARNIAKRGETIKV